MEEKTKEQIADAIRDQFGHRRNECMKLESKLAESIDMINLMYKVEDIDKPVEENNMPRVSVSPLVHNAMIWYPKQTVRAILEEFTPFYDTTLASLKTKNPLKLLLIRLPKRPFDVVAYLIPGKSRLILRRHRTVRNMSANLHKLQTMLNDEIDGKAVGLDRLVDAVPFAEIIAPERASKNLDWVNNLYKELKRINHNQIVGFAKLAEKKKRK